MGALLGRLTMKPMHTATGLYEVSVKAPSPAAHAQLMAAHVAWVTRPAFLASVMNRIPARRREATLFRSPEHFSEHLTVSHLRGSELIQISVINEDQNAANVAVKELTKAVQEAAEAGPTGAVVDVHIIGASGPEPVPIRDRSPVVAGGIAGAVVAWLLWLYWHRRHQRAVLSRLPAV